MALELTPKQNVFVIVYRDVICPAPYTYLDKKIIVFGSFAFSENIIVITAQNMFSLFYFS